MNMWLLLPADVGTSYVPENMLVGDCVVERPLFAYPE